MFSLKIDPNFWTVENTADVLSRLQSYLPLQNGDKIYYIYPLHSPSNDLEQFS